MKIKENGRSPLSFFNHFLRQEHKEVLQGEHWDLVL